MKKRILLAVLFLLLAMIVGCDKDEGTPPDITRGTPISGNWSGSHGGVFTATADLTVPAGQTLTLQPGTEIQFDRGVKLDVYGKIVAIGSKGHEIIFTTGVNSPDRGVWGGVILHTNTDTSKFKFVHFRWGSKFELVSDTIATVGNVFKGILSVHDAKAVVENCSFARSGWDGVDVQGGQGYARVDHSIFFKNAFNGVRVRHGAQIVVTNSIFITNDDAAIREALPGGGSLTGNTNDIWNNVSNPPRVSELGRVIQAMPGDISVDPMFADPDNFDFTLLPGSPVIDQGDASFTDDPDNTRTDMGAYYYHQSPYEIFGPLPSHIGPGTFKVVYDVTVPQDCTVTIAPGTVFKFDGLYAMHVMGTLHADGTNDNWITFTSNKEAPDRGDWKNIYFDGNSATGSSMSYCKVKYASNFTPNSHIAIGGISVNAAAISLNNVYVEESLFDGIHLLNGAAGTFRNLDINGFGHYGISCELNIVTAVEKFKIRNGLGTGINITNNSSPHFSNGLIVDNGTSGVRIEQLCNPVFNFMTIANNQYNGMSVISNSNPTLTNSIIASNSLNGI
ncbi:MAG: right-handed parallel beta-helix repeat-containing protein [bacterium]|nr:right-handed parallel beta-helix repeat-containing protein [bacterium]